MKRTGSMLKNRRSFLLSLLGTAGGSAALYSLLGQDKKGKTFDPYANLSPNGKAW